MKNWIKQNKMNIAIIIAIVFSAGKFSDGYGMLWFDLEYNKQAYLEHLYRNRFGWGTFYYFAFILLTFISDLSLKLKLMAINLSLIVIGIILALYPIQEPHILGLVMVILGVIMFNLVSLKKSEYLD